MRLAGRTALVTGAARRIGKAIAMALGKEGARVAVHYRSSAVEARAVVRRLRALGAEAAAFRADLADPAAVPALVAEVASALGPPTLLVNSASEYPRSFLRSASLDAFERVLRVNLTAPFLLCREVIPHMRRAGSGKIVNLGDVDTDRPRPGYGPYTISKAGLHALTLALATELAPLIQVNAVAPGAILPPEGASRRLIAAIIARTPARSLGDPGDVASAVLYLLSASRFVTGHILAVDGGRSRMP